MVQWNHYISAPGYTIIYSKGHWLRSYASALIHCFSKRQSRIRFGGFVPGWVGFYSTCRSYRDVRRSLWLQDGQAFRMVDGVTSICNKDAQLEEWKLSIIFHWKFKALHLYYQLTFFREVQEACVACTNFNSPPKSRFHELLPLVK